MSDPSMPAHQGHPWRILVLDRDPADPKWLLATVVIPADVIPADVDRAGRYGDWEAVTAWVCATLGQEVVLVPVHDVLAWRVDAAGSRDR